ncbi:MAG: ABC transporter permease [Verrucomicrobiae bacterium]|nr:ABC transporter permease [Verrucomicrobiae bacterium]
MSDLKFALRQLLKHPFTNGVILLTVALLIGTVSVLYASMRDNQLKLMPFPERERMVKFFRIGERQVEAAFPASLALGYRENLSFLDEAGTMVWGDPMTLTDVGEPTGYAAVGISASLLRMTGVVPAQGRLFHETDELTSGAGAGGVIISEQLWREKLDADPDIIGRELRLNNELHTVVGVLPAAMRSTWLAFNTDLWLPVRFVPEHSGRWLWLFGRLKPGVSRSQAQAELDTLAPVLEREFSSASNSAEPGRQPFAYQGARVAPLDRRLDQEQHGIPPEAMIMWLFAGIILASVVGIACFNITHLLLVRVLARQREFAIRLALGANRWRVVRQVMGESILVALLGGALGLAVSFWFHDLLRLQQIDAKMDWRLYALAAGGSVLLGSLIALLPALQSSRANLTDALKEGGQMVSGRRRHRFRNFLVASEVTMALILCVVAGSLLRVYLNVRNTDLGIQPAHLLAVSVDLRNDSHPEPEDRNAYADQALRALGELPGVELAAVSRSGVLSAWAHQMEFTLPATADGVEHRLTAATLYTSQGAAALEGMRLLAGRDLSADSRQAAREALVNESFARDYFQGGDPLDRQLSIPGSTNRAVIVGVVGDRHPLTNHQRVGPEVICGHRATALPSPFTFLVRTRAEARTMAGPVREVLRRIDARQPVAQAVFIKDLIDQRQGEVWQRVSVLGSISGVGLLIALLGVHGVVAFSAIERTREVGVRLAVGATRAQVLRLIMWQGGRLLILGAVPGLLIGTAIMSALPKRGRAKALNALDPWTLLGVILVVGLVGLLACLLPARRAVSLNPMEALRTE